MALLRIDPEWLSEYARRLDKQAADVAMMAASTEQLFTETLSCFEGYKPELYKSQFLKSFNAVSMELPALLRELATELRKAEDAYRSLASSPSDY